MPSKKEIEARRNKAAVIRIRGERDALRKQLAAARKKLADGAALFENLHGEKCACWADKPCYCEEQQWVSSARERDGAR